MNTKYLFTAIAIVVIAVIALFVYNQEHHKDESTNTNTSVGSNDNTAPINDNSSMDANTNSNANSNSNTPVTSAPHETTKPDGNDTAVFQVSFDGKAFNPAKLTIKSGDVVIFKNTSQESFWPASDPHPTHTNYPEFDPKKAIAPGQSWQFKFTKAGSWGYHDHLNPSIHGTITVQ